MNTPNKKAWRRIRTYILTVLMLVLLILFYEDLINTFKDIFHVQIAKYVKGCEIVEEPQKMDRSEIPGKLYFIAEPDMIVSYEIATGRIDTMEIIEDNIIVAVSKDLRTILHADPYQKGTGGPKIISLYWKNLDEGESKEIYAGEAKSPNIYFSNSDEKIVFTAFPPDSGVFVYIADTSGVLDSIPGSLMPKRYWQGNLPFILYVNKERKLCRYDLNSGETINIDTLVTEKFASIIDSKTVVEYRHARQIRNKAKPEKGFEDIFVQRKIDIYTGEVDSIIYDDFTESKILPEYPDIVVKQNEFKAYSRDSRYRYELLEVFEKDSLLWKTWITWFSDILDFSPDGEMILAYTHTIIRNGKRLEGPSKEDEYHILAPNGNYYNFHIPIDKRMGYIGWE